MGQDDPPLSDAEIQTFMRRLAKQVAREEYDQEMGRLNAGASNRASANASAKSSSKPAGRPELFTIEEAARRLHKSRRWLQGFIRQHPYCRLAGRTKLFSEYDICRLIEALPTCPLNSNRRVKATRTTRYAEPISGSGLTEALALLEKRSQERRLKKRSLNDRA